MASATAVDEDLYSYVIDIPKPRVFATKSNHVLNKCNTYRMKIPSSKVRYCKPSEVSLRKYALNTGSLLLSNILKDDRILLSYRLFEKRQTKIHHKHNISVGACDYYKIRSTDLRRRMYIEEPVDDVDALTDIDPSFFTSVDGRPLRPKVLHYKSLKSLFRNLLMTNQEIAYRKDCILNVDIVFDNEKKTFEQATQRFQNNAKYFDNFISHDYQKSMGYLSKQDKLKDEVHKKHVELQNTASEIFYKMSRIIELESRYGLLQKYGRFLYYLAPQTWRQQHREFAHSVEIEAKGFDLGISKEDDTFSVLYEKLRSGCQSGQFTKTVMYFNEPNELMKVFERVEQQQLNHFTYVSNTTPFAERLKIGVKTLKDIVAQDSALTANLIEDFEISIRYHEERCKYLEAKFFKILNGPFYDCVGSREALKFFMNVEFCYETVFSGKLSTDFLSSAKALENYYLYYTKRLDQLRGDNIQKAVVECMEQEKKKNLRITEAVKELRLFARLKHALLLSFAPPFDRKKALSSRFYKRRVILKKKHDEIVSEEQEIEKITDAEREYLKFFTDWCPHEDPAPYLESFREQ